MGLTFITKELVIHKLEFAEVYIFNKRQLKHFITIIYYCDIIL